MNENNDKYYLKLYELDYDPGYIEGYIVLKKSEPVYEKHEVFVGYDWELDDFGGWGRLRRIKVAVYETHEILVGHKFKWQVFNFQESS